MARYIIMNHISYKQGYKYQLSRSYTCTTPIKPKTDIETDYIDLTTDGVLTMRMSYAWDGPSGPTIDTSNFMRPSLVHDALYQLMQHGHLDPAQWRSKADRLLRDMCRADGMSRLRSWWVYRAVRQLAGGKPMRSAAKQILQAPR
jgi:hypothetical protein